MTDAGDVDAVEKLVRDRLGSTSSWVEPDGYPDSLALCAIDSIYSLQSHYTATVRVLDRYRAYRREQDADPNKDGAPELLAAIQEADGPAAAADSLFGNRAKAPGTKRLKSEALADAVARLAGIGVETTAHLRSAEASEARRAWSVKGLGPVSWDYLLMLAGAQGVKADTKVRQFVTTAVGESCIVSKGRAERAVKAASERLGSTQRALDHAIWQYQRTVQKL
ncbi:hypothetical protein [Promicromonospora sukumoe]|uniref:hypothetical protein n=1 Tax=Promicromonospora sukumoe TaxID=88382 RepID=UPI000368AF73|nr:hypothetical protein [Promicromonospora sukumoe]